MKSPSVPSSSPKPDPLKNACVQPAPEPAACSQDGASPGWLHLCQSFAEIANTSHSSDEGLMRALEFFCRQLGWAIGHGLITVDNSGKCVDSGQWWVREDVNDARLRSKSASYVAEAGDGLLGEVIATGRAAWTDEDLLGSMGTRAPALLEAGVRCAVAFPILTEDRVAGILEFFTLDPRRCEPDLIEALPQLGTQLGRLFEREHFERAVARASQQERRDLGRELHDTLSQQLAGTAMLARALERRLEAEGHAETGRARQLFTNVRDAQQQLRAVTRCLNPVSVHAESLAQTVEGFLADTAQAFGLACESSGLENLHAEDDFMAEQILCIVREAVHNSAKHASGSRVTVSASVDDRGNVELLVTDDGTGFDPDTAASDGMGLRTLRYRARLISASIDFESEHGAGTTVRCAFKNGGPA